MDSKIPGCELQDFHDSGMHATWLVEDTATFPLKPGRASERDRLLHFGLNYQEWFAIFFHVLGVDKSGFDNWAKENPVEAQNSIISEFLEEIPGYPFLSRIVGMRYDIIYEIGDVEPLKQECLRLKSSTSNPVASKGIHKLVLICDWAQSLELNIYLLCD